MLDLIIRNARSIDGNKMEIGVSKGKIVKIDREIAETASQTLLLSDQQYLSAGWIDSHVHCFEALDLYYDYPDEVGVKQGVTTIIDAGSSGAENLENFYQYAQAAQTNVYALLNISKTGIIHQDELADLENIQKRLVRDMIEKYPDFIKGIKARMSRTVVGENGLEPLKLAKKIQAENQHLPLMVHIGSAPPQLDEILSLMEKDDILTHCFNGKENGILNQKTARIKNFAFSAKEKGIIFDIGHGTDSFNFKVAEQAFREGLMSDSISTDIYIRNRQNGPVHNLATTMEKLHEVGYTWVDIINQVTVQPAKSFRLTSKGQLKVGFDADFTIFEFLDKEKELIDSQGNVRRVSHQLKVCQTIIGGKIYDN